MGYIAQLQRSLGRALKGIHRVGGWRATYTLCTDMTTDPITTVNLDVYMNPIQQKRIKEIMGGRIREIVSQGMDMPLFILSREYLLSGGTYYNPTFKDTFVERGTSSPIYRVEEIENIGGLAAGWYLLCRAHTRAMAAG